MSIFALAPWKRLAWFLVAVGVAGFSFSNRPAQAAAEAERVRQPAVAGTFYSANADELKRGVINWLSAARLEEFKHPIKAIVAPHAGHGYCGQSMAAAFKQIEGSRFKYDTVVMIGPSHRVRTKAAAVSSAEVWKTPLGPIPVDTGLAKRFTEKSPRIEFDDRAHALEHSLEVQLPFLMVAAGGKPFKIIPLVTTSSDPLDQQIVADALTSLAGDPRTLILVSTDLSHFPDAETAERVDKAILRSTTLLDPDALLAEDKKLMAPKYPGLSVTMCGMDAVLCLLRAAGGLGIDHAKVVSYTHSGMPTGDTRRVVGYGAIVFTSEGKAASSGTSHPLELKFSEAGAKELVAAARQAAKAAVLGEWVSYEPSERAELDVRAGCFVTLTNNGRLRGCIGRIATDAPLWRTVREMAVAAATMDDRFVNEPIKPEEIPHLSVEISVLSPLRKITDPLKEIKLGRDGIVITDKGRSGTFLPQVAVERGWSLDEFLGYCARDKACLGWNGWKSPSATIHAYTATIIEDSPTSVRSDQ